MKMEREVNAAALIAAAAGLLLVLMTAIGCDDGNDLIDLSAKAPAAAITAGCGAPDADTVPICPTCGTGGFGE